MKLKRGRTKPAIFSVCHGVTHWWRIRVSPLGIELCIDGATRACVAWDELIIALRLAGRLRDVTGWDVPEEDE